MLINKSRQKIYTMTKFAGALIILCQCLLHLIAGKKGCNLRCEREASYKDFYMIKNNPLKLNPIYKRHVEHQKSPNNGLIINGYQEKAGNSPKIMPVNHLKAQLKPVDQVEIFFGLQISTITVTIREGVTSITSYDTTAIVSTYTTTVYHVYYTSAISTLSFYEGSTILFTTTTFITTTDAQVEDTTVEVSTTETITITPTSYVTGETTITVASIDTITDYTTISATSHSTVESEVSVTTTVTYEFTDTLYPTENYTEWVTNTIHVTPSTVTETFSTVVFDTTFIFSP